MAFIIPNATDTTSSNKYAVLDQAEPDSLDFEILGNDRTGVINGCVVSPIPSGSSQAVSVSSGVVVLDGVVYPVVGNTNLNIDTEPGQGLKRFDLVVARLSGTTMSLVVLKGAASSANPTYPVSESRLRGTANVNNFKPTTDVALATIYRATGLGIVSDSHIVEKRKLLQTAVAYRGSSTPSSTTGGVGDLYLRTSTLSNGESGLYVKRTGTDWVQLAAEMVDPGVPVGSVITWVSPSTSPNPSIWAECNGTAISRVTYSALFNAIGSTYGGGDGSTTFNLPDFRGMFIAGLPITGGNLGTAAGNPNNQVTLTGDQIPGHTHNIDHGHATVATATEGTHQHIGEAGSHVHAFDHGHTVSITGGGSHTHMANYLSNANNTGPNHYLRPIVDADGVGLPNNGQLPAISSSGSHSHNVSISRFTGYTSGPSSGAGTSTPNGLHQHNVTIPSTANLVSKKNINVDATAVNIQPRTMYVRYFIRCA